MVDTVWGCTKDVKSVQGCNVVCFNRNNNKNIGKRIHVCVWYARHWETQTTHWFGKYVIPTYSVMLNLRVGMMMMDQSLSNIYLHIGWMISLTWSFSRRLAKLAKPLGIGEKRLWRHCSISSYAMRIPNDVFDDCVQDNVL